VLVDAAVLAADIMRVRKEWMDKMNGSDDSDFEVTSSGAKTSSLLEESLCVLNESLCNNSSLTCTNNDEYRVENERGSVAMHSFRSALKVVALATGKLILPKVLTTAVVVVASDKNDLRGNKQTSKRRKIKKEDESRLKKDAWNSVYLHSSPNLYSRDRLVDALSFHLAAIRYPQNREMFIDKRSVCFEEAVNWENQAGALYDNDEMMDTDGCAGYVWKIRNCLLGMETMASASRDYSDNDEQKRVLQSLELMASSSFSQFACDLLGCIYSHSGDFSRALAKFQLSLDHGERNSRNADEEIAAALAERRTIVNMALCFLSMGEVNTPLELLLHLWMTFSESQPSTIPNVGQPMALLISSVGNEMECMANSRMNFDQSTKIQLLWKLFYASSLAQDWSTCLNATEEMVDGKESDRQHENDIARAFALLQCRRTSAAQETTRLLLPKLALHENKQNSFLAQLIPVMAELYHADALLLNEQSMRDDFVENEIPLDCTQRAIDALGYLGKMNVNDDKAQNNTSLQELQVTIHNDHGIALLMKGDSVGALRCFREAAKHTSAPMGISTDSTTLPWLLLPTYFNLSLLLLRDGHMEESAKSWLHVRGHFSTWQKAVRGDNEALRKLKDLRVMAINRHGLLMAKRSMQDGAMIWDQENIMEWMPPVVEQGDVTEDSVRVGGVDASQITALDVVLLRYAVSNAEKKSSSSFRRSAGHLGY